jgi:hypothetical protein
MSARKQIDTQKNMDLMSDYGKLPGYHVDYYADRLTVARRKFDRLCEFSFNEHEASFEDDGDQIDWDLEKKKMGAALDRWLRETYAVMRELLKLFHQLRDDQTTLDVWLLEQSSRRKIDSHAKGRARSGKIR